MTERQRRDRIHDARPPSLHMRRMLRRCFFEVHRLLRGFRYASRIGREEAAETLRVLELCRRATARDGIPPWLLGLNHATPPDLREAVAALTLVLETLAAVDIVWDRRLVAAGIDPKWPDSGA